MRVYAKTEKLCINRHTSCIHYCVRLQKHRKANDAMEDFIQIAFPNLNISGTLSKGWISTFNSFVVYNEYNLDFIAVSKESFTFFIEKYKQVVSLEKNCCFFAEKFFIRFSCILRPYKFRLIFR